MSDSLNISTTVSIVKTPTPPSQPIPGAPVPQEIAPTSIGSSNKGSSTGERKMPEKKEPPKIEIEILPLDEPMIEKISNAIDKSIYGKELGAQPDNKTYVKGYAPFNTTGQHLNIKG